MVVQFAQAATRGKLMAAAVALVQMASSPFGYSVIVGSLVTGMSDGKGTKAMFAGRHFDREVILLCVRWYLRYKLSLRDLVEMITSYS